MIIPTVFWLVPIASIVALGMAFFFFRQMMAEDEGTPRMREIALNVRKGAMAYLKQQYKVVGIVFVILCALFAFMAYGALRLPDGWFLLWLGRLLRYEDSHLRFCPYS